MLTWINEKAKWIIAISAVGIGVGLLAMDNIPDQAVRFPLGEVNGRTIAPEEFDSRVKTITENQRGKTFEDEQYAALRADVFRSFVRQYVLEEKVQENGLGASVAEMKDELLRNMNVVRNLVGQEAQQRLYMIQSSAANAEEANQRIQLFLGSLPKFLVDTAFTQEEYEQWLNSSEAYEWASMMRYEQEMKNSTIPMKQLQTFVAAGVHPTSLEARFSANRRLQELDLQVASVSSADFSVDPASIDSAAVVEYFNANPDSFFVREDVMRVEYALIPLQPSAKDDANIRDYAMTLYNQLLDSSASFAELARLSSEDPGSAEQGGLLGDYTARGAWVKEFENAAFALDSGAISEPVRTQFGYHIIQSHGKMTDSTGVEKVKAAHILITVTPSSQTEDSLSAILASLKTSAESGKAFKDAAKEMNLEVKESAWIPRQGNIQETGYLQGFSSFLFANENSPEPQGAYSNVLKNKKFVFLAFKKDSLVAGERQIGPYFDDIRNTLAKNASAKAAKEYLTSVESQIKVWNPTDSVLPTVEKVTCENAHSSVDGFVAGIGYGSPILSKILKTQKVGEWGTPIETESGAVLVRINAVSTPSEEALNAAVSEEVLNSYRFASSTVVSDYVQELEASADVVNNLDLYYKD